MELISPKYRKCDIVFSYGKSFYHESKRGCNGSEERLILFSLFTCCFFCGKCMHSCETYKNLLSTIAPQRIASIDDDDFVEYDVTEHRELMHGIPEHFGKVVFSLAVVYFVFDIDF